MENDFQKRVWTLKGEKSHGVKSQPCLLWLNCHKSLVVFPIKCFGLKFAWRFYSTRKELSCDAGSKDYFLRRAAIPNFPEGGQRIFSRLKSYLPVPKLTEKHCSAQRLIVNLKFEGGTKSPLPTPVAETPFQVPFSKRLDVNLAKDEREQFLSYPLQICNQILLVLVSSTLTMPVAYCIVDDFMVGFLRLDWCAQDGLGRWRWMAVNRCCSGFGRRNIRRLVKNYLPFLIAFFKRRATVPVVRYAFQNIITGVCAKTFFRCQVAARYSAFLTANCYFCTLLLSLKSRVSLSQSAVIQRHKAFVVNWWRHR